MAEDLNNVKSLVSEIRKMGNKVKIIVGGAHATLDSEKAFKYIKPDFLFIGEAEDSLRDFVKGINPRKINGILYEENSNIIINPPKLSCDLDKYKIAWDLLDILSYPTKPHGSYCKQSPIAQLTVTRGCPFNCSYCGATKIAGYKIRSHSLNYVINEIELLVRKYGIREIHIEDDNFTMNKEFVKEFCNKLSEKDFGITWLCPNGVRLDTLDEEMLLLMKKSGFIAAYVGIESGSDRIRKHMHKNLSTETIIEKVNLLRKCKIDVIGFFIVGYPTETIDDINKTIDLAIKLDLKRAAFNVFKPIPSTDIYKQLLDAGEIRDLDYANFNYDTVIYSPKGISKGELKRLRQKAIFKFYFRPKQFYWLARDLSNYRNIKSFVRRVLLLFSKRG